MRATILFILLALMSDVALASHSSRKVWHFFSQTFNGYISHRHNMSARDLDVPEPSWSRYVGITRQDFYDWEGEASRPFFMVMRINLTEERHPSDLVEDLRLKRFPYFHIVQSSRKRFWIFALRESNHPLIKSQVKRAVERFKAQDF